MTEENGNVQLKVTSFEELQKYARGNIVRFSDFSDGQPFVARVRRPGLMALAKAGRIPNRLMNTAAGLFGRGGAIVNGGDENVLGELYEVCKVVAEAALIEPTLAQIEEAGMELSDQHLIEIFRYTQKGVDALDSFRGK